MSNRVSTIRDLLGLAGLVGIGVGVWQLYPPLVWIYAGVAALAAAVLWAAFGAQK